MATLEAYKHRPWGNAQAGSKISLQIWLEPHTIEWLRQTRNYASLNLRAEEIIEAAERRNDGRECACGCGRLVTGKQTTASPACRQRLRRQKLSQLTVTKNRPAPAVSCAQHPEPPEGSGRVIANPDAEFLPARESREDRSLLGNDAPAAPALQVAAVPTA